MNHKQLMREFDSQTERLVKDIKAKPDAEKLREFMKTRKKP